MSLAAMVLADRVGPLMRYYDRWMRFITAGRDEIARNAVLDRLKHGDTLLDVGCGTGTLAIAAALRGARVTGIDCSSGMLALARDKAARHGVAVDFRQGQAPVLPVSAQTFDVVAATFALSELSADDALLAVRAMAQAARPGGRVMIADEDIPEGSTQRAFARLLRVVLWALGFLVLLLPDVGESLSKVFAPTHRHAWRALLQEAGLVIQEQSHYQSRAITLVVAERPATLSPLRRETMPLETAFPRGIARLLLRVAAWFALPIPVPTGVYRLGRPTAKAPVLLTGNFLATVEAVHRALAGLDCYVLVEDTGGWNVWCASDARIFTAEKAVTLIDLYQLDRLVEHRTIIIPRLGGRIRAALAELSHWQVITGPIEARDLPEFLREHKITPPMRSLDRMYRLAERVRVGALTFVQLPLWLIPLRFLPSSVRAPVWRFSAAASWVLSILHYRLPGRTGIVKGSILGLGTALLSVVVNPRRWREALAVVVSGPLIGWIYQSSSPVVYWKRIWK